MDLTCTNFVFSNPLKLRRVSTRKESSRLLHLNQILAVCATRRRWCSCGVPGRRTTGGIGGGIGRAGH